MNTMTKNTGGLGPTTSKGGGVLAAVLATVTLSGCSAFYAPLPVVENVDLERYAGRWYEIARNPNRFERGCVGVTADYTLRTDGRIGVVNTVRTIEGTARVVDTNTNAKLGVTFFWPFEGDYWILELGEAEDYGYAVVGEPSRRFLWILSREPTLDDDTYAEILSGLPELGYEPDRLEAVPQDVGGDQ